MSPGRHAAVRRTSPAAAKVLSMFGGFEQPRDEKSRKRWFASAGTSLAIYVAVGIGLLILARQTVAKAKEEAPIDVTFHSAPDTPEPIKAEAPPPPPKPGPRPKRPGKVAPVQPKAIPTDRPEEGDPTGTGTDDEIGPEYGDGDGTEEHHAPTPLPPPPPPPPPPPALPPPPPVEERDDVVLPVAMSSNQVPAYPEAARRKGQQGDVVLVLKISATGAVIDVQVVRGDEPFLAAALAAVKSWRYRPAMIDGQPAPFTRRVKIPFRIRT